MWHLSEFLFVGKRVNRSLMLFVKGNTGINVVYPNSLLSVFLRSNPLFASWRCFSDLLYIPSNYLLSGIFSLQGFCLENR